MMALGLADWLRIAGLRVVEVAGWQTRGHGELRDDARNMVVVDHHTAGSAYGTAPSLSTVLYGVPGVPGPLANVLQTREPDGNDVFMIIAAGTSYNAGTGGFAGVSGNWSTIGIECEHTGVELYPANRAALTQRFNAAVLEGLGHTNGARTCQHFEWSDTGKIDIATGVDANAWRQRTTEYMQGGAPVPPATKGKRRLMFVAESPSGLWLISGDYGVQNLDSATANWLASCFNQQRNPPAAKITYPVTDTFINDRIKLSKKFETVQT